MNKKKDESLKKHLSNVPNPPVPNRAHTEMNTNNNKTERKNKKASQ